MVSVSPSCAGSLHDRTCQLFYELVGGTVDFQKHHSCFHGHNRFGETFPYGKIPIWNAENPILLIGHSLGAHFF
jgi:hypothetical protein